MENKKSLIENAARQLAAERGAINLTRAEVCRVAGVPDGAFTAIMDETFVDTIRRLELPAGEKAERKRAYPVLRYENVLDAAIATAKTMGYYAIRREDVASRANISPALVSHYFGTIEELRALVLKTAIKRGVLDILAQGLARKDPMATNAPQHLKDGAVSYLAGL